MTTPEFEFKSERCSPDEGPFRTVRQAAFEEGTGGWELVSVLPDPTDALGRTTYAQFRRPQASSTPLDADRALSATHGEVIALQSICRTAADVLSADPAKVTPYAKAETIRRLELAAEGAVPEDYGFDTTPKLAALLGSPTPDRLEAPEEPDTWLNTALDATELQDVLLRVEEYLELAEGDGHGDDGLFERVRSQRLRRQFRNFTKRPEPEPEPDRSNPSHHGGDRWIYRLAIQTTSHPQPGQRQAPDAAHLAAAVKNALTAYAYGEPLQLTGGTLGIGDVLPDGTSLDLLEGALRAVRTAVTVPGLDEKRRIEYRQLAEAVEAHLRSMQRIF